jgi:hypothetical protein
MYPPVRKKKLNHRPIILKGSSRIAPMNFNKASTVKPIILKGSRISHKRGNKKMKTTASGQQMASRMNQSRTTKRNRMTASFQKAGQPPCGSYSNYRLASEHKSEHGSERS